MYERIVTFAVGLMLGVIGTYATVHRPQKPVDGPSQISVQVDPTARAAAIIRQMNETQEGYRQQQVKLQSQVSDLQNERDKLNAEVVRFENTETEQTQAIATWQNRSQACEAKFQTGTIISEPRALISLPVVHGLFSLSVNTNSALGDVNGTTPVFFVPAQVQVTSRIPGVTYLWIDPQGGAIKGGPFPATMKQ
jgi:hypothetical protein